MSKAKEAMDAAIKKSMLAYTSPGRSGIIIMYSEDLLAVLEDYVESQDD